MEEDFSIETALTHVLKETVSSMNVALTEGANAGKWFPEGIENIRVEITFKGVTGKLAIAGPKFAPALAPEVETEPDGF